MQRLSGRYMVCVCVCDVILRYRIMHSASEVDLPLAFFLPYRTRIPLYARISKRFQGSDSRYNEMHYIRAGARANRVAGNV